MGFLDRVKAVRGAYQQVDANIDRWARTWRTRASRAPDPTATAGHEGVISQADYDRMISGG
jgi:hypothetical protein